MPLQREIQTEERKKLGLTALLIGLVTLVVVLTSTIILVASYESKKQSIIETTLNLNLANANRMSKTVDSLFNSMRSSLEYSAKKLTAKDGPKDSELNHYLELMRYSSDYFNSIVLVNEKGMVRKVAPESLGSTGLLVTSKPLLDALALKKPYISEPYITTTTKRLIVFMSQPLFNSMGHNQGILGGTLYLQENNILNMIFGNNAIDHSGSYYYIVGSDGHLLFHPDKSRIGDDVSDNKVVQQLMQGKSGRQQVTNTKGVDMLAGYSSVPANGWGVVAVSSVTIMHKQLVGHLRMILWYTLVPFILLLLVVIIVARRLANPFVYLADLVSKIGKEKIELPKTRPHWNREADLLTKTIFMALTEVQKQTDQLTQEAMTDSLTGLMNRRTLELTMTKWIAAQTPFSLIVMDVDKFKFVNDTYGHLTGDEVLKRVAEIIVSSVRPGDVCCRYGGEEFIIMLARTRAEDAYIVAERIRKTLEKSDVATAKPVTVSQGIAHFPSHADSREALLDKADQALYSAKKTGRNKTIIADF